MKLLQSAEYECVQGSLDLAVTGIFYHCDKVIDGSVFVCIEGAEEDGHSYAEEAVRRGAGAIVCQKALSLPEGITVIRTEDSRKIMAEMSAAFYGHPARKLRMIGVTGTKGKTTTAFMIQQILLKAGQKCGLIGTVHIDTGKEIIESDRTTPESVELQGYLRRMADCGCTACVMEVSSQALKLARVHGLHFDYAVFTNLSEDHIGRGEHKDFAEYAACKAQLFCACEEAVVNEDDPYGDIMLKGSSCKVITYGMEKGRGLQAKNLDYVKIPGKLGVEFQIAGDYNINLVVGLPGKFSCYNAMAATAVCSRMGADKESIRTALREISVPGRQEMFSAGPDKVVMVDYAHNGVALENLLRALRDYKPKGLNVVFGCGGQRDKNRRTDMAKAAASYADFSIITSDNPRKEEPEAIISDITKVLEDETCSFTVIGDRREAIHHAVKHLETGEIVVIAGKGHENYQIIGEDKIHFDDRKEVLAAIEKVKYEYDNFRRN